VSAGLVEADIALYNDSLERCTAQGRFLERFYDLFVASSAEVAEKFERTDFGRQTILLKASLYMMMLVNWEMPEGHAHLERIARVHDRKGWNIRPQLYDVWLECLLVTVKEFDPEFDGATEQAWRRMLAPGIAFMKSRY
jgi:hemoglobin-like flavoprotein